MCADHLAPGNFPLAILAKAPLAGQAKTRLIPALGAEGAARLQAELIRHTLVTALKATRASAITLWTALDHQHPLFLELAEQFAITLKPQPEGDLGARMHHALHDMGQPGLLIGTDCPVLDAELLTTCQSSLTRADAVFLPAEDGGYVLVGVRRPSPQLFSGIDWGSADVMAQTMQRLEEIQWSSDYPTTLWDVDRPEDIERLRALHQRFHDFY